MVGEIYAGLSSLKIAFDLAKGLKDIDDATRRNAAVIELQDKILSAQTAQSELVETVSTLKGRVAELESWDLEKQRYKLTELAPGIVCYALKDAEQSGEAPHRLCANCFAEGKKSFLQQHIRGANLDRYRCNRCHEELSVDKDRPPQRGAYREPGDGGSWMGV